MSELLKNEEERKSLLARAWDALPTKLQEQCGPISDALKETYGTLKVLPSYERKHCWSYSRDPADLDENRIRSRLGRIVRRQLMITPAQVPDEILGQFTNRLNTFIWKDTEVRRIFGNDITTAYSQSQVSSCMSGDNCDKVELYAVNPERVSLLVVVDENEAPVARALLWVDDQGKLVLDRVYGDNGEAHAIVSFADGLGAITRTDIFSANLPNYQGTVTIKDPANIYPYLDTFCYATRLDNGRLRLSPLDGECEMHSTEGFAGECCEYCGESTWSGNNICDVCAEDYTYCEHCATRLRHDYATYIQGADVYVCDACLHKHYANCERCEAHVPISEIEQVQNHETLCISCVKADPALVRCADCEELFDREQEAMTEYNGQLYCQQCTPEQALAGKERICA